MQNQKDFNRSFRQVLKNKTSFSAKELFARWFVWLDVSNQEPAFKDAQEEAEIVNRMEHNLRSYTQPTAKQRFIQPYRIAAAVAVTLLAATGLWLLPNLLKSSVETVAWTEAVTLPAERKIILMTDGSRITLNNDSKLRYAKNFSGEKRELFLEGEAFFEVAPDKTRPFIVHTGKLDVTVLGTSFNVRNYQEDSAIDVVVATGRVGVNDHLQKSWTLTPGNKLSYDSVGGGIVDERIELQLYTAWKHGELILHNEKLSTICKRLERWYGVTIHIETETLRDKRISLREKNENLKTVLRMLELAGGFTTEVNEQEVIIR